MNNSLIKEFSKNRAEEFSADVWEKYVVPPNYDSINLFNYEKAVMVEGGRGSGKTSFLRFHCHDTRFSSNRLNVPIKELSKIGLYFRPDTHFCTIITPSVFGDEWPKVFGNYLLLNLLKEFSLLIENIEKCDFENDIDWNADGLSNIELPRNFNRRFNSNINKFSELADFSDESLDHLLDWVNDFSFDKPLFPDPRSVIISLVNKINKSSIYLKNTVFNVYIDEFENLTVEQQKLVNTWIKHGSEGLVFSAAYKKYGKVTKATNGNEQIVLRNDYRKIDIEDFSKEEFHILASEILILKLGKHIDLGGLEQYRKVLCMESSVAERRGAAYKDIILNFSRGFFPSETYENVALKLLDDSTLHKRLRDFLIKPAIDGKLFKATQFIDGKYPVESLINGALLNRKSQKSEVILKQFSYLIDNGVNDFYRQYKDLLVGVILWIYLSAGRRVIPIYSGFDRICLISQLNIRHFLEICHQCLVENQKNEGSDMGLSIPIETQALAARKNSELEVEKVSELGTYGNSLRFIVNRLGLFFQLLQRRKAQSEPEIIHFSVRFSSAEEQLPEKVRVLLEELKLWQVLIEFKGDTKRKSALDITANEYMLHPIFSSNFSITYRKIRKHVFKIEELETLFCGTQQEFMTLCQPYVQKNSEQLDEIKSIEELQGSLFDDFQ